MKKKNSPKVNIALEKYFVLRQRQHDYYFGRIPLKISNRQYIHAYSDIFNLCNDTQSIFQDEKLYQKYQMTFLDQYQNDLKHFCLKCHAIFKESKHLDSCDLQIVVDQLLLKYRKFMNWLAKIFNVIQRATLNVKGIYLINQGLKILRTQFIEPIYEELFELCIKLLVIFKSDKLSSIQPLQQIIKTIGVCGFTKFRHIKLLKQDDYQHIQFCSLNSETKQYVQNPFDTDYFKKKFTNKLIEYLQEHYRNVSSELIKLSAPEYITNALQMLKTQQQAADHFYYYKNVKQLIIRSIQEVLVHEKAKQLLDKENTGLKSMLQSSDIVNVKKLYTLMKRSNNLKLLGKQYQKYIEYKGTSILDKITAQDQKNPKKQVAHNVINQFFEFYELIDKITVQISGTDVSLQTSQNFGFQLVCNKTNKLIHFLAYYADNSLRKDQNSLEINTQLVNKIRKISKFFYSYDAFLKLYQKLLGIRILYDCFKNTQTQYSIINLLKNQAGVCALNKITCMIEDIKFSQKFNQQKFNSQGLAFNTHVMILTSGSWQIQDSKNGKTCVPPQLLQAVQKFQKMYLQWWPGRSITWLFNYGRAIVHVQFNTSKHLLILNNYQLQILLYLQRQKFKKAKVSDLISQLKVTEQPAFLASLSMLNKIGVIVKQGNPGKIQSKQQKIHFNLDFKYKTTKVGCFQIPKHVEKVGQQNTQLILQRSYLIDAAIVKLMKSKRVLQYSELIVQVQKMCKTFKAEISLIKQRIQNCQERQFLVRDQKDMHTLIYKP